MVNFYTQWIRTNDMRKTFEEAQKTLRKEFPSPNYTDICAYRKIIIRLLSLQTKHLNKSHFRRDLH